MVLTARLCFRIASLSDISTILWIKLKLKYATGTHREGMRKVDTISIRLAAWNRLHSRL